MKKKPANDHMTFYPPDWKEQMKKYHEPSYRLTPRPLTIERVVKKKHLSVAERLRRTFRVVE